MTFTLAQVDTSDLAQFVSDYHQLEDAQDDSDKDVAVQFLDGRVPEHVTDDEFDALAAELAPQIGYYR